jgi:hypothetical protein
LQFEYTEPQTQLEIAFGGYFCINIFGKIEEGDDEKFRKFLERSSPPPRTNIYINSKGGNVEAAMGIGRLIRAGWFSTSVGSYALDNQTPNDFIIPRKFTPGKCLSAATLAFLGGRLRHFDTASEFGVHQFSFRDPSPNNLEKSQRLSASIARYIEEMGIPAAFLEQSALTPRHELVLLSEEQLNALNVVTGGITDAHWSMEAHEEVIYVKGERDSLFGHGKVMLCYSKVDRFTFCAMVEAMGREHELTNFGLVEIVVDGEDTRIDISDRCARVIHGIYVMIFAKISETEARTLAYSTSFGVQVRTNSAAEIFLGIAAVSTVGGDAKLKGLYNHYEK